MFIVADSLHSSNSRYHPSSCSLAVLAICFQTVVRLFLLDLRETSEIRFHHFFLPYLFSVLVPVWRLPYTLDVIF